MTEIAIIAATFFGNKGAEAMISSTIGKLREAYPEARFNVYSYYSKIDRTLVSDKKIEFYSASPLYLVTVLNPFALIYKLLGYLRFNTLQQRCPESVKALARSKVLICLAGVSFVDGRTKFLPFNIATILPAMILGTPVVKFAQAVGSFKNPVNAFFAQAFLKRCRMVFTRGNKTHEYLQGLLGGPCENVRRANDIAFLFQPGFSLSKPELENFPASKSLVESAKNAGKGVVGICPSIVVHKKAEKAGWNYADMVAKIVSALSCKGYHVVLFPNATRGSDASMRHNNDLPLIENIFQELKEDERKNTSLFTGLLNAAQIHEIIRMCDIVAVSRFHAMIGALSLEIPVTVIGWSHKYLEVMELFEQEDMVLSYEEGHHENVVQNIIKLESERVQRAEKIRKLLPEVRALAQSQVDYVCSLIENDRH